MEVWKYFNNGIGYENGIPYGGAGYSETSDDGLIFEHALGGESYQAAPIELETGTGVGILLTEESVYDDDNNLTTDYALINEQTDLYFTIDNNEESKIIISIRGIMDKSRYSKKKYIPKITDCNILRNVLLYGKQGYNLISRKRNSHLTNADMEEIFISKFLNNLSITEKQKIFITNNTFARVEIVDPIRGNDIFCNGKISEELQ